MKTRIIILCSVLSATLQCVGQEWIGNRFLLDTIVDLQNVLLNENLNLINCKMQGDTFFFFEQQGFQHKENGHRAVIHTLRTDNYAQTEITLPMPECNQNKERYANSLWIYDICFEGDYLLVTTQNELILYKRINNQNYQVVSTYRHQNLFMGYLHQNSIYYFEEDHDKGFKWFHIMPGSDSAILVRELSYEAPILCKSSRTAIFPTTINLFSSSARDSPAWRFSTWTDRSETRSNSGCTLGKPLRTNISARHYPYLMG